MEIILPAVEAPVPLDEPVRPPAPAPRGSGTVLLVDDMDPVRKAVAAVLRRGGYEVVEARGGEAALELCARHPGAIDLLLTDVVMPEVSGPALVARAAPLRPAMKVLYMSGHAEEDLVDRGAARGEVEFLGKPVPPAILLETVRRLLGR